MNKTRIFFGVMTAILLNLLLFTPIVQALTILPGYDLFETPDSSNTYMDFSSNPIPPDFFGPGSDPFTGIIELKGMPLQTSPSDILGPTDTIVRRTVQANLPSCPSSATVDIEIVALSLVSVAPITITYNGGQNPEPWDVYVCLSENTPQTPGSMTINQNCPEGGSFNATLPVLPKFTFTYLTNILVIDYGQLGYPPINFTTTNSNWTHTDPGLGVITSPGGLTVDDDCDGVLDVTVGASSNFFVGIQAIPCDCVNPVQNFVIDTTVFQNPIARHAVIPPIRPFDVIPTLNEWGMIILALLLITFGTVAIVRRRKIGAIKES